MISRDFLDYEPLTVEQVEVLFPAAAARVPELVRGLKYGREGADIGFYANGNDVYILALGVPFNKIWIWRDNKWDYLCYNA